MVRTMVKVCGLTRLADAHDALAAGADWLGFVVIGDSPRKIDPEEAGTIARALAGAVTVAVMVAPRPDEALAAAALACADRVQLHRVDSGSWPDDFPLPCTFAVPVDEDGSLTAALPAERHLVMLDTAHPEHAGGTGQVFPWETARIVAATRRVVLAGGLDGDNVAAAIERVRPFGVDASSRLESRPGIKDAARVRRFVTAVRRTEERLVDPA